MTFRTSSSVLHYSSDKAVSSAGCDVFDACGACDASEVRGGSPIILYWMSLERNAWGKLGCEMHGWGFKSRDPVIHVAAELSLTIAPGRLF